MTEPTNTTTEAITASTEWGNLAISDQIRHLELEGYLVIPDLIPPNQMSEIRDELDRLPTISVDYSENQRGCNDVQWTDSPA